MPKIVALDPSNPDHVQAFERINRRWIEAYFVLEPEEAKLLADPKTHVLDKGGEIWLAVDGEAVLGTVALKPQGPKGLELTKLGVSPQAQGLGLGRSLLRFGQDRFLARQMFTSDNLLFLESNSSLTTARALYDSEGWVEDTPPEPSPYARADVYMTFRPDQSPIASGVSIGLAETPEDIAAVKVLFRKYAEGLGVDLCFQGFEEEMATFPAKYDRLLLAKRTGTPIGAVGIWTLEDGICEMKRLYLEPEARGLMLGRSLSLALMELAARDGFHTMKLDTLERLTPAVRLYRDLGFSEIAPYNPNPESDILYFARTLGDFGPQRAPTVDRR